MLIFIDGSCKSRLINATIKLEGLQLCCGECKQRWPCYQWSGWWVSSVIAAGVATSNSFGQKYAPKSSLCLHNVPLLGFYKSWAACQRWLKATYRNWFRVHHNWRQNMTTYTVAKQLHTQKSDRHGDATVLAGEQGRKRRKAGASLIIPDSDSQQLCMY